jgi:hypothetical protein
LVLSAEVKDRDIGLTELDLFTAFLRNLDEWPDATAIAVARSFTPEARATLLGENVLVLDRVDMLENVQLWDLRKQQLAMRELEYFFARVQRNTLLLRRFQEFLQGHVLR